MRFISLPLTGKKRERMRIKLDRKRLELAERDRAIQGYEDGVFWERNARN
jgi:hypothetical protein